MTRSKILASAAVFLALGACATQPAAPPPAAAIAASEPPSIAPDATPYGLFLAGRAARDEGELSTAAVYFARAAQDEGDPTYLKADAFHAALESGAVTTAAELAPAGADAAVADVRLGALVQGVEDLAEGQGKAAYAALTGPDQGYPYKVPALLLAPFAAAAAGDQANALARPPLSGDSLAQFVADLNLAEMRERLGMPADAERSYKAMLANGDPGGVVGEAYGGFLERRGRSAEAVPVYQAALAVNPDDDGLGADIARAQKHGRPAALPGLHQAASSALIIPAASLISQKQFELALIDLRLAVRLDPGNDQGWLLVGNIMQSGDVEAARAAYGRIGPGSKQYVAARGKLAFSYQSTGDHETALKLARETVVAVPGSRDAQITLANLLRDNDQYEESAAVLTRLIDGGGKPDWRLYYLRASAYDQSGDSPKTEADLDAALKLDPDEPELLNFQGYFWIDRGEHLQDALAMVQRAVDAEPQSGAIIDSLGWAYYRLGDFKSAVANLENAVTLDASVAQVNDHLGDAYWRVGRKTEAVFQWRRVLILDPDPKLKASAEAKLASPLGPDVGPPPIAPPGAPPPDTKTP